MLAGSSVPSVNYEWFSVNGSAAHIRSLCAPDTRCAGYYMCNPLVPTKQEGEREGDEALTTCDHLKTKADAVLLSGVPAPHLLKLTPGSTIVRKREAQTCDGTAEGATCSFPFKSLATGDEFYECSITGSERPWCYTTRPGRWGYCDCNGNNPIGLEWQYGKWGECSKPCGGGLRERTVTCRNSTTNELISDVNLCGKLPPTVEACNTQSCDSGCSIPHPERKICAGFYEDFRSKISSVLSQKKLCRSYGCCYSDMPDATAFKLGAPKCYTSVNHPNASFGCKLPSRTAGSVNKKGIKKCGDQCCTEVAGLGACGQTLGYAQLNSKDPCSRYKSIANTESDVGWRAFPVNERSTSLSIGGKKACNSVSTTKESSVRACQAACALADGCNAINFNAHAKICELVKCEDPARPNTIKSIGWLMFSFGVVDDTPVVNWIIGPEGWSDCVKKATGVTWGNSSCEMSQTRQVACMGVDGKKVDESLCLRKEPRPESSRTCWGSCGVKRSCEELRWDGLAKDASSCGSGVGLGGTELGRSLNFNHKSVGRGCYKPQTFQKAEDICKSNGARLCTVKEMNEEVTGHDPCWGALFWTSTKCPDERTGNGYWVAPALRSSSTLSNGCARPTEVASVACCSEFARTNKTRTVALKRERANGLYVIKNGYTGYCDGPGGFPCKRYEGSCRPERDLSNEGSDCMGSTTKWIDSISKTTVETGTGDMCGRGVGPKYGLPKGSNACIPRYHVNQITFTPTKVLKSRPVDFIFTSRSDSGFPTQGAKIRIVKGYNVGCMGVWEDDFPYMAASSDSTHPQTNGVLAVQGGWRERPIGYAQTAGVNMADPHFGERMSCGNTGANTCGNVVARHCEPGGVCSPNLPASTEPFIEWKGVMLDEGLIVGNEGYEEPMHHVCLCDTSKLGPRACRTPANWHDLGELELQPASDRFPKQPPLNRILLAVGGDLLETYAWKDVLSIRNAAPSPDLVMATDHNNPYHRGADALHELCSQKCLRNDRCRGFSMTLTVSVAGMHQGYRDALQNVQCALKGDKVQLRDVANADSSLSTFRWYYQRQEVLDEEWHYFPQINFHSSGPEKGILDNPTLFGHAAPLAGLNASIVPPRTDGYDVKGILPSALRSLMLQSYHGAFRSTARPGTSWGTFTSGEMFRNGIYAMEGFSYEERGHSGDGKVFAPTVQLRKSGGWGDDTPFTRLAALRPPSTDSELSSSTVAAAALPLKSLIAKRRAFNDGRLFTKEQFKDLFHVRRFVQPIDPCPRPNFSKCY